MKLLVLLAVFLHIAGVGAKETMEQECARVRKNGDDCTISPWKCEGTWDKRKLTVEYSNGGSRWKTEYRQPCGGGGGGGGKVDGNWGEWRNAGDCSKTCSGGTRKQIRLCNNPSAKNGGKDCSGGSSQTKSCNTQKCPEECTRNIIDTSKCEGYKIGGFCTKQHVAWMRRNCCKTCTSCTDTAKYAANCKGWAESGECSKNREWMLTACCASCKKSGVTAGSEGDGGQSGTTKNGIYRATPQGCLKSANFFRRKHRDTPDLVWDNNLALKATAYAVELASRARRNGASGWLLPHDQNRGDVGENLAYRGIYGKIGSDVSYCKDADERWYDEIKDYSYATTKAKWSGKPIGHFTQMEWVASKKVGYGISVVKHPYKEGMKLIFVVARYDPKGNFNWRGFRVRDYSANVKPPV